MAGKVVMVVNKPCAECRRHEAEDLKISTALSVGRDLQMDSGNLEATKVLEILSIKRL